MTNAAQSAPCDYQVSVLRFPEDVPRWNLVHGFLAYRKQIFVDRMEWDLHNHEGIEFEQYDAPNQTIYVIAHRDGVIIGGARLRRTDAEFGQGAIRYSYMIRDACRGLLDGMPTDLCWNTPPVDRDVWELTRFAADQEPGLAEAILRAANDFIHGKGGFDCLFLGPPAFMRMAKKLGWAPEALGPISGNHDGRFLAFKCAVMPPAAN
ncbi:acyl-homoserine-lactone synthase [Paracoccus laeviglucosivorans]|uniref:Acyl-homoserine-lactone synthase n=1 Tax=Paracoccus laeviglucosivorans TaxID=1197861 RepID=A0A521FCD5_9RHOB|nr:acyl-homoserine-lactone synthase [Paracoccus laeviglucosivorans]SMO93858.1 acyl homoserine lactone synthase [Paracoccus laeviglucosivorans]